MFTNLFVYEPQGGLGESGVSGVSGTSGQGPQGVSGTSGQGPQGVSGTSGQIGTSGTLSSAALRELKRIKLIEERKSKIKKIINNV